MSQKSSGDVSSVDKSKQRRTIKVEKIPDSHASVGLDAKQSKPTADSAKVSRIFYYEEEEASRRDPKKDLELHQSVCAELRHVMTEIQQIKQAGCTSSGDKSLSELRVHGSLQFISLKKLNRIAHFRSKKVRDSTSDAKLKIDQHHLKLQNLLYEVAHLEKEISKCLQFKSSHEDITLVPVEQFYQEASEDISKPDATRNSPHQLTLARLHWELEQRKRLSTKLKEAAGQKNKILTNVRVKKDNLDSLQPKLNAILQTTKPVQDHLGMPFDAKREQYRAAMYLPSPLYVLYVQTSAFADACDKQLTVTVQGDVDLARSMEQMTSVTDDDNDNDDNDETEKPAEIRRRRTTSVHDRTHSLLRKHPLNISMTINCPDKTQLELTFYYMTMLNFATVAVKLNTHELASTISGGDLLLPDNLLACLYPGDDGMSSPNPSNLYLSVLKELSKNIGENGRPYHWVQWLCGLQFLEDDPSKVSVPLSVSHMSETIGRLRSRVTDRLILQKQLAAFEQGLLPVPATCVPLFPTKILSRLSLWKRSTFEDFSANVYSRQFVDAGVVTSSDLYFTAAVERGSVTVTASVVVPADYPSTLPLMLLSVMWQSTPRTALNDEAVRNMESELNVYGDELRRVNAAYSLTNLLQRLLVCVDVYLETSQHKSTAGTVEFTQDRIVHVSRVVGVARGLTSTTHNCVSLRSADDNFVID